MRSARLYIMIESLFLNFNKYDYPHVFGLIYLMISSWYITGRFS